MASHIKFNPDSVTAANSHQHEVDHKLARKAELNPPKPKQEKQPAPPPAQKLPVFTTKDAQLVMNQVEKSARTVEKEEKAMRDRQARVNAMLRKYGRYYSDPVLSKLLPLRRPINTASSEAEIQFAMEEAKLAIAIYRAKEQVPEWFLFTAEKVEELLVSSKIADAIKCPNLSGFTREALRPAMSDPVLNVEMAEFVAE
jgi:hypothetical protein